MSEARNDERTDVFIRCYWPVIEDAAKKRLREGLFIAVEARWRMQADARITLIFAETPTSQWHMNAKRFADENARSEIYVVADDDCLIIGQEFLQRGVGLLRHHPEFGLLTATSIDSHDSCLHCPIDLADVVERHSVGGVAFVRKGILKDFAACDADHTDGTICDEITQRGYKVGVMPRVGMNHLGFGYSISSKGHWSA